MLATAAPELLHTVEAQLVASAGRWLPSLESFTRWLTCPAVAQHVRRLSVSVAVEEPAPTAEETAAASLELGAAIVQIGAAAGGAGLFDLCIATEVPVDAAAACEMVAPSLLRCRVDAPAGRFVHATGAPRRAARKSSRVRSKDLQRNMQRPQCWARPGLLARSSALPGR